MALDEQQAKKIKEHLLQQLESFPEEQRENIRKKVEAMNSSELELFLKQNELQSEKCIFCEIAKNKIKSFKISENKECMAVLEINPAGKGHTIIIPKIHDSEITESILNYSKDVAERLKIFSPKEIKIAPKNLFGHNLIDVIPVFEGTDINKRQKASEEELEKIQKEILIIPAKKEEKEAEKKEEKPKEKELPKIKPRIP